MSLNEKNNSKSLTLKGRLNQPITTELEALEQLERNGDTLSEWAKKKLSKLRKNRKL